MERAGDVSKIWNWLPAFRAVAETQHLPTASKRLHVSASSLSRTIRLLEEEIGAPLFLRTGGRITLNEAGERLLVAVQHGMKAVHDGTRRAIKTEVGGPLHVGYHGAPAPLVVLPAVTELRRLHPAVIPRVTAVELPATFEAIERGVLDVAFLPEQPSPPRLATRALGLFSRGIYCGRRAPLRRAHAAVDEILEHSFVVVTAAKGDAPLDGFPSHLSRHVGLEVTSFEDAAHAAADTSLLVVLPDPIGASDPRLRRLDVEFVPPLAMIAVHRVTNEPGDRATLLVDLAAVTAMATAPGSSRRRATRQAP